MKVLRVKIQEQEDTDFNETYYIVSYTAILDGDAEDFQEVYDNKYDAYARLRFLEKGLTDN